MKKTYTIQYRNDIRDELLGDWSEYIDDIETKKEAMKIANKLLKEDNEIYEIELVLYDEDGNRINEWLLYYDEELKAKKENEA